MLTIIGFVPKANDPIDFPVGWKEDGTKIGSSDQQGWPSECQLLLLDDNNYATAEIPGNDKPALLVQHLGTSKAQKEAQLAKLKKWKWQPSPIEEYSRIVDGYPFWRDIKDLLISEREERILIIRAMAERYGVSHSLQKLDTLAAWFILYSSTAPTEEKYLEYKVEYLKNFQLLTSEQRISLGPLTGNPAQFLKESNSIAAALIAL